MTLIVCKDCDKNFSDKSSSCPSCGAPNETLVEKKNANSLLIVIEFIIGLNGLALLYILYKHYQYAGDLGNALTMVMFSFLYPIFYNELQLPPDFMLMIYDLGLRTALLSCVAIMIIVNIFKFLVSKQIKNI